MTVPLERVLRAFLEDPAAPRYGYDLMKAAGLQSGTLYPLLARLEHQKLVASAWETPQREGQRPRKYYRLTSEGIGVARLELARSPGSSARRAARPAWPPAAWDEGRGRAAAHRRVPGRPGLPARAARDPGGSAPGVGSRAARHPARSGDQVRPVPRRPHAGLRGGYAPRNRPDAWPGPAPAGRASGAPARPDLHRCPGGWCLQHPGHAASSRALGELPAGGVVRAQCGLGHQRVYPAHKAGSVAR